MKSVKTGRPTYKMPLDELLELLGATRRTAAGRKKPQRASPRPPLGEDRSRTEGIRRSG
jgi:hypothetical protein